MNLFGTGASAELSSCGVYRYLLTRQWDDGPCVGWLMFNPSTADATEDDATIRKCVGFSRRWGYGRLIVVNLFALRNRDPKAVAKAVGAIGPLNDYWLIEAVRQSRKLVCAWGCAQHFPKDSQRITQISTLLSDGPAIDRVCLGRGKDGSPRHPLMLGYDTPIEPYVL